MTNPTVLNSVALPQSVNSPTLNAVLSTAMTSTKAFDGTDTLGTAIAVIFSAATAGSTCPATFRVMYSGTNGAAPSGTSTKTVLRLWANNGSANTTAGNNTYIGDYPIPAQTYTNTDEMPPLDFALPPNLNLPGGWRLLGGLTTAMGGTNCALCVAVLGGGDFA